MSSGGDFLLEQKHVTIIGVQIRNVERMRTDWPVVTDTLLPDYENGSVKNGIADLIKGNDIYGAVRLTLYTWIENENEKATFHTFLAAIPAEYSRLRSTLIADMEKIRSVDQVPNTSQADAEDRNHNSNQEPAQAAGGITGTGIEDKDDFLVEESHAAFIAIVARQFTGMEDDWSTIMRLLLTNSKDASVKSQISDHLTKHKIYQAVLDTVIKWRATESKEAWFSVLLNTIEPFNPALKDKLSDAREDIRKKKISK